MINEIRGNILDLEDKGIKPACVNLTVGQGFALLKEFHDTIAGPCDERIEEILIKRDECLMIELVNSSTVFGLPITVNKLVAGERL